jgi:hypothetical protein
MSSRERETETGRRQRKRQSSGAREKRDKVSPDRAKEAPTPVCDQVKTVQTKAELVANSAQPLHLAPAQVVINSDEDKTRLFRKFSKTHPPSTRKFLLAP